MMNTVGSRCPKAHGYSDIFLPARMRQHERLLPDDSAARVKAIGDASENTKFRPANASPTLNSTADERPKVIKWSHVGEGRGSESDK
jgi:hypothetical protein